MHVRLQGVSEVSEMKIANFVNILASYLVCRIPVKMHQAGDSLKILYLSDNVKIKIQQIQ